MGARKNKRNPLNKRLPREFKKNAGKYIGIFFILITTIIVGSSFMAVMDSAVHTLEVNDKECKIEDGYFEVISEISDEVVSKLEGLGLKVVDNHYLSVNEFDGDASIIVFGERKDINLASVFEGELPDAEGEIAIERLFAANRDIAVGDNISFNDHTYKVTATIAIPDYNCLYKNNQDLLPNTTGFGICIVTEKDFEKFNKSELTYRYSYKFDKDDLSEDEEKKIVENIQKELVLSGATLQTLLTAEKNQAITFLREDMGKDGPVIKVFIYILVMIIAFVFAILTSNNIEAEAAIIGTLRASGYKKSEIVWHYLSPTIIIAILSSIVGNGLGYTVMIEPFKNIYYGTYSMAPIDIQFNIEAFVTTTILPVVIMIVINWWMLYSKLSLSPLKFLRKDLHKKKQKKARKLPDFKFLTRFRIRVLLQNKVSYLILFVGIFLSSFLLMFGMGLDPLIDNYVDEVDDSLTYEYQYILKAPVEAQNENAEKLLSYSLKTWFELGKMDMNVSFMGISDNTSLFKDIELQDKENEITITAPFAEKMGLEVGDEIVFKDDYYDKEYTLKVAYICEYKGSLTVFMKRDILNKMLGNEEGTFNSYVSNEKIDIADENVAKLITRADMVGAAKELMKSFEGIMQIINVFAVIVYMILMYILTKIVIEKNAIPISFMKIFGYNDKEIGKLYLNATTVIVIVSLVVCIPLEALCFKFALVYIGSMIEGHIPFYLPAWLYVAIIAIGIVAYFAINTLHIRKIRRISMSEALKNRE